MSMKILFNPSFRTPIINCEILENKKNEQNSTTNSFQFPRYGNYPTSFKMARLTPQEQVLRDNQKTSERIDKFLSNIQNKNPQTIETIKKLQEFSDENAKNKFALSVDCGKNTQFDNALFNNEPKAAIAFLDFVKTLDKETQSKFALSIDCDKNTQFNNALFCNEPKVAVNFLDFVKTLDKETQSKFVLLVNDDKDTQFNVALLKDQPGLAFDFFRFAVNVAPKEVSKWDITMVMPKKL